MGAVFYLATIHFDCGGFGILSTLARNPCFTSLVICVFISPFVVQ